MRQSIPTQQEDDHLDKLLLEMEDAINHFHSTIHALRQEQQHVVSRVRKKIDQKKIDDIHAFLSQ